MLPGQALMLTVMCCGPSLVSTHHGKAQSSAMEPSYMTALHSAL